MPERERKQKPAPKEREEETVDELAGSSERGDKLTDHTADLLDEIDSVLEDNAEEFVRSYVQKGGQ
jgi:ubiquitin-like protein Pup